MRNRIKSFWSYSAKIFFKQNSSKCPVRQSAIRQGFTLVEVLMVSVLAFLVFSALAAAMSSAFHLWSDALARWKLAEVARRTRVIFLDGARNDGIYKGTGFLSVDRNVFIVIPGLEVGSKDYRGYMRYHYPALNQTNEFGYIYYERYVNDSPIGYEGEQLMTPYYAHAFVEITTNADGSPKYYRYAGDTYQHEALWFADFSVSAYDMPEDLYIRKMFPIAEIDVDYWAHLENSYYLSLTYDLVYLEGWKQYVHPEHIKVRMVNVHY